MSLVEKYALLPEEIDRRSIEVVEASLPRLDGLTAEERYVVCRIVRAEGDPEIAKAVGFSNLNKASRQTTSRRARMS